MRRLALGAAVVSSLCLGSPRGVAACGFAPPEVEFWYQRRPAEPLERFLAGHLGIVDPAWDRAYRYVAWRHLSGLGLEAPSREALATYWQTVRPATEPSDRPSFELWSRARACARNAAHLSHRVRSHAPQDRERRRALALLPELPR